MATLAEQEVTITVDAEQQVVRVYSAWPKYCTRLRKNPDASLTRGDGTTWGEWEVPLGSFPLERAFRKPTKRQLTDQQRAELAARLAAGRA